MLLLSAIAKMLARAAFGAGLLGGRAEIVAAGGAMTGADSPGAGEAVFEPEGGRDEKEREEEPVGEGKGAGPGGAGGEAGGLAGVGGEIPLAARAARAIIKEDAAEVLHFGDGGGESLSAPGAAGAELDVGGDEEDLAFDRADAPGAAVIQEDNDAMSGSVAALPGEGDEDREEE